MCHFFEVSRSGLYLKDQPDKNLPLAELIQMRLSTMANTYRQQEEDPAAANLSFEERMGFW